MAICFASWWWFGPWIGISTALFLAWGDGITGLVRHALYHTQFEKGWAGSVAMLLSCLLIALLVTPYWDRSSRSNNSNSTRETARYRRQTYNAAGGSTLTVLSSSLPNTHARTNSSRCRRRIFALLLRLSGHAWSRDEMPSTPISESGPLGRGRRV